VRDRVLLEVLADGLGDGRCELGLGRGEDDAEGGREGAGAAAAGSEARRDLRSDVLLEVCPRFPGDRHERHLADNGLLRSLRHQIRNGAKTI
jgi:hypothetical protein